MVVLEELSDALLRPKLDDSLPRLAFKPTCDLKKFLYAVTALELSVIRDEYMSSFSYSYDIIF